MRGTGGKFVVGGNWKCNGNTKSIAALVKQLNGGAIGLHADVEIICAPPALYLPTVRHAPPPRRAAQHARHNTGVAAPRRGRNLIA
jgi:triosephosphate isomerase